MTEDQQRRYVRQWLQTGRLLEEVRWRELREIDNDVALRASDMLIDAALRIAIAPSRRNSSGLVEQQAYFHRLARP